MNRIVLCDYCHRPANLVDSAPYFKGRSYGMIWRCDPCDAHVGVHKGSADFEPLGRLANPALRRAKMSAHGAFDPIWKASVEAGMSKGSARTQAYAWLAQQMQLPADQCHIGMFDEAQCRQAVELCRQRTNGAPADPVSSGQPGRAMRYGNPYPF